MEMFNWADWVILAIVAISGLFSIRRGFVKEALSLATWVAAFVIARLFTPALAVVLVDYIQTPSFRIVSAFAILFVLTLIVRVGQQPDGDADRSNRFKWHRPHSGHGLWPCARSFSGGGAGCAAGRNSRSAGSLVAAVPADSAFCVNGKLDERGCHRSGAAYLERRTLD